MAFGIHKRQAVYGVRYNERLPVSVTVRDPEFKALLVEHAQEVVFVAVNGIYGDRDRVSRALKLPEC